MPVVVIRPNESQDQLLKRFRKKIVKSGVLSTVRRKRWFVSKSELRRVEKKKAIRRMKRRQSRAAVSNTKCALRASRLNALEGGEDGQREDKIQVEGVIVEALPEPSSVFAWTMGTKCWLIYPVACVNITFASS